MMPLHFVYVDPSFAAFPSPRSCIPHYGCYVHYMNGNRACDVVKLLLPSYRSGFSSPSPSLGSTHHQCTDITSSKLRPIHTAWDLQTQLKSQMIREKSVLGLDCTVVSVLLKPWETWRLRSGGPRLGEIDGL